MVFFSKSKTTAVKRVKELSKKESFYKDKVPILAKEQISHSSGWKTWKLRKK